LTIISRKQLSPLSFLK